MRSAFVALALLLAACGGRAVPFRAVSPRPIAGGYSLQAVRDATLRALEGAGFRVEHEEGARLYAAYVHRRAALRVVVDYAARGVHITYVSSEGFNHHRDERGVDWIHPRYERLLETVHRRIGAELERPARERRMHELAVARARRAVVVAPVTPVVSAGVYGVMAAPSCEAVLAEMGHTSGQIFCRGADPWCAAELLYQGHEPIRLGFCRDVDASCAVDLLRSGGEPIQLGRCRY